MFLWRPESLVLVVKGVFAVVGMAEDWLAHKWWD